MKPQLRVPAIAVALVMVAACAGRQPAAPAQPLEGFDAPLTAHPDLALIVAGAVGTLAADVALDLAAPMSTVTAACFPGGVPKAVAQVRLPRLGGGVEALPEVRVPDARIGGRALGELRAAVVPGAERCVLSLGLDRLMGLALHVDPQRRRLALSKSRSAAEYAAEKPPLHLERFLVDLTRDPNTDRLLVPVRLRQWDRELAAAFLLGSAQPRSFLAAAEAERSRFETDGAMAVRLHRGAASVQLPSTATYSVDGVELAPGVTLPDAVMIADPAWQQAGAVGVLGPDLWGRFEATIDPLAQVLVVRRPRLLQTGRDVRCEGEGGTASEERCYALDVRRDARGLDVIATIWRDLPEGGHLYFELVDEQGTPTRSDCQFGVTFEATGRGLSTAHRFPWDGLETALPACAEQFRSAANARFAIFQDGPLQACPGHCGFVHHLRSRRTLCECPKAVGGAATGREEQTIQLLRRARKRLGPPPPPATSQPEPEPD